MSNQTKIVANVGPYMHKATQKPVVYENDSNLTMVSDLYSQ